MSNIITYYCALRNITSDSPVFQDSSEDLIREVPDLISNEINDLPSVPTDKPSYLGNSSDVVPNKGNNTPSYLHNIEDKTPIEYPNPPEIYYIPIADGTGEDKREIIKYTLAYFKKPAYMEGITEAKPTPRNNFLRQSTPNLKSYIPPYAQTDNENDNSNKNVPEYLNPQNVNSNVKDFFQSPPPPIQPQSHYLSGIPYNTAPNEPQFSYSYVGKRATNKGIQLFEDVFSRADKNDDGGLTFEEFTDYFGDGVLSSTELLRLFNQMDLNSNGNIELPELIQFFSNGFEPFKNLFSSLAQVHSDVTSALVSTFKQYQTKDKIEQFKTRVYLKEFLTQISSLRDPVQSAFETMVLASSQTTERVYDENDFEADESKISNEVFALREQVDRLSILVENMAMKQRSLRFSNQELFEVDDDEEHKVLVARIYEVIPEMALHFRETTRAYVANAKEEPGNLLTYVSREVNCYKFTTYEVWEDDSYLSIHNQAITFKHYQKDLVDCLESPAIISTIPLPSSWWCN